MKGLKFRVWDKERECYLDETELAGITPDGKYILYIEEEEISRLKIDESYAVEFNTGLKDKNGKEIYEGDIVDVIFQTKLRGVEEHKIWVCRFGVKRAGFVLNRETNSRIFSLAFGEINAKNLAVEVIGNIHEDADLLDDK